MQTPSIESAFYLHRASAEHALAKAACSSKVAAIHEWLAQIYQRLAAKCQAGIAASNVPLPFPSVQSTDESQADNMPQAAPPPVANMQCETVVAPADRNID